MISSIHHSSTIASAPPLILLGGGGHAKVVARLARAAGRCLIGVCDPALVASGEREWRGLPVMGDDSVLALFRPDEYELALGVGTVPGSRVRTERYLALSKLGYRFPPLIHPSALVDESSVIDDGAQVMAGAIVQPDCRIGRNVIINTGATIDHDVNIGDHVHIAPGAVLCGGVKIGAESMIGASATLLPQVTVGARCLVAAGSTLARPLADGAAYRPYMRAATKTAAPPSSTD